MKKKYLQAPLPFVGQKRMFASEFKKVLTQFSDDTIFVDLFGGSGLLSHIVKCDKPQSMVVYNDFDNYRERLDNVADTNNLLANIRTLLVDYPYKKLITGEIRDAILGLIQQADDHGYVDYITLSANILFSAKTAVNIEELRKHSLYNRVRRSDYCVNSYLDGIEVVSCDYRDLFEKYKALDNVVFLLDPPYLNTDVSSYNMSWKLADYLDVLTLLIGSKYVYFTSNKSDIIELCEWIGNAKITNNPFDGANKVEINTSVNYNSKYIDIMLYKSA